MSHIPHSLVLLLQNIISAEVGRTIAPLYIISSFVTSTR